MADGGRDTQFTILFLQIQGQEDGTMYMSRAILDKRSHGLRNSDLRDYILKLILLKVI